MENLGKPAVMMLNRFFVTDAKTGASVRNLPNLRLVPTSIPCEVGAENVEEIRAGVTEVLDELIKAVTQPLTPEEESPTKEVEKPPKIIFKGDLQEVTRFFYKRGWSYGMPVIPPTEEAVKEMLTGTDLPADHVVARIPPRLGRATVEKIAVNAVMAGCLPTYMPILIAGVQSLVDPGIKIEGYSCSVASWALFWVINGPIRNDLNINSGRSLMSPEFIANSSIARAMGLIMKNIGGVRPGKEDMACWGHEGKYSMCFGENEEDSPWEPLHVSQGFNKEDNTITVHCPNSRLMIFGSRNAKEILRNICHQIMPTGGIGGSAIIMTPAAAKLLAADSWTKKQVHSYIVEFARMPAYARRWMDPIQWYGFERAGVVAKWGEAENVDPLASMPLFIFPETVKIIVAGGTLDEAWVVSYSGGGDYGGWVTKKIELPADWDKLVKKYKDIVPTYARY
jgi:hypothetical protein